MVVQKQRDQRPEETGASPRSGYLARVEALPRWVRPRPATIIRAVEQAERPNTRGAAGQAAKE